ncbi:hypothetical protein F6X40_10505 [Paraburkholderia sp. UCT31]|uniref:hypothetical protein n=1 Tax=Paraburkholderia sp. UCT31 TaxID=2615209 RepID=UPI0016559A02|nr:hypothetical protein [Paraburkholderia sp. UCT31]MBC8737238.1 hypothetical protein [Paraburkholderia sp. UCT31]
MDDEQKQILRTLAPYLIATALVAATLVLGALRFFGYAHYSSGGSPQMVQFDVVKLANAQRAVASQFLKSGPDSTDNAALLLNLSTRTREAITKAAGKGTLVLVKQGIVQGDVPDITDDVLRALGLPTDVPTQDPTTYTLDVAPTNLAIISAPKNAPRAALSSGGGSILP